MVKKIIFFTLILALTGFGLKGQKITVSTDVQAEFFFNGQTQGERSEVKFKLNKKRPTMVVDIKKNGYVPVTRTYSNLFGKPAKSDFIRLEEDEAFNSSTEGDFANKFIAIETGMEMDDAWRYLAIISRQHFEVLKVSDKATGYMQSTWYLKKFNHFTVRQRFIASQISIEPLAFNVKIESQIISNKLNNKVDENYEEWDRVLKSQADMFAELQMRMRQK